MWEFSIPQMRHVAQLDSLHTPSKRLNVPLCLLRFLGSANCFHVDVASCRVPGTLGVRNAFSTSMTPSVPLELASSADLHQIFAKIESGARRRQIARHFELPIAELRLGDPRIAKLLDGTAPVWETAVREYAPVTQPVSSRLTQPAPVPAATLKSSIQIRPVPGRSRRCQCGTCMRCLDNARWERIFTEKFADPTYYKSITVRHNSTLAGSR